MAKTDFSSSSPLAGSFLTDHTALAAVAAAGSVPLYLIAAVWQSLLCGYFTLCAGLFCLQFLPFLYKELWG